MNQRHWRVFKSPNICNHPSLFLFHIPNTPCHWPLATGHRSHTFYIFSTYTYSVLSRACVIFFAPIYHIPHSPNETLASPSEPAFLVTKSLHLCLYPLPTLPAFPHLSILLSLLVVLLFIKEERYCALSIRQIWKHCWGWSDVPIWET